MLQEEEMHQNTRNEEDSTFLARTKKGKGKDSDSPSSSDDKKMKKKKIKCFYCSKSRHEQNKCRKKLDDEKNNVKKSGNNVQEVKVELFVAIEEI